MTLSTKSRMKDYSTNIELFNLVIRHDASNKHTATAPRYVIQYILKSVRYQTLRVVGYSCNTKGSGWIGDFELSFIQTSTSWNFQQNLHLISDDRGIIDHSERNILLLRRKTWGRHPSYYMARTSAMHLEIEMSACFIHFPRVRIYWITCSTQTASTATRS